MRKPGTRGKKHIDQEKVDAKKQAGQDLRRLLELGDEEGYVNLLKALRPDLTPQQLVSFVEQFREERRKLSRDFPPRP